MKKTPREKTIIVGYEDKGTLDELAALVWSAGGQDVARITPRRTKPNPAYFLSEGKLWELKNAISAQQGVLVVFDDELTPVQARNLEAELMVKVLDRTRVDSRHLCLTGTHQE